ncbi:MAG TPA: DUF5996 family protein [Stellaceae bacterium]|nr:DUF5996 family protein [Stellaceae bacterium]
MADAEAWPSLPLEDWRETYATLHMWTQIVGKTRLALAPAENHWWHVSLQLTPAGLTTGPMPYRYGTFAVAFDFVAHRLQIETSAGARRALPLAAMTVADFYAEYREALAALGIELAIMPRPVEVETAIPFAEDRAHCSYDADAVRRFWRILAQADLLLKLFRGRFLGKASPVHFFWGSFDLALTRFSGRAAPRHPGGAPNTPDRVMIEAYSHECSSCGFWPGGGPVAEPAFYAYAYPEPPGYAGRSVSPASARYDTAAREFILPYAVVRSAPSPQDDVLAFLQGTYEAAADLGRWDRAALDRPRDEWPRVTLAARPASSP